MKKWTMIPLLLAFMLLFTACSPSNTVRVSQGDTPGLGSDIDTSYLLPGGKDYTVAVGLWHNGEITTLDSLENISLTKEETLQLGGTGESFVEGKWSWKIRLGEKALDVPVPEDRVEAPGATYDLGEKDFEPKPGDEYLLAYAAGMASNIMDTSTLSSFSKWSSLTEAGQEELLSKFSYVYLVTLKVTE